MNLARGSLPLADWREAIEHRLDCIESKIDAGTAWLIGTLTASVGGLLLLVIDLLRTKETHP